MVRLLAWGDTLFLVGCELGKLQLQRMAVDASEKKVSLHQCKVHHEGGAAALPVDALLVAAKEVEDTELATRYPVLVFQASKGVVLQSNSASSKRRRSPKNHHDPIELPLAQSHDRLLFCVLFEIEGEDNYGLQLLNMLEIPTRAGENGDEIGADFALLQVFLTDGPHVLLFERFLQLAMVLKLQKATQGGREFQVWLERVDVFLGMAGSMSAAFDLVSCAYVSETLSSRQHLLIYAQLMSRSSDDAETHIWSILELDEGRDGTTSSLCRYLNWNNQVVPKLEQVTCCCFISELSEWTFAASAPTFSPWDHESSPQSSRSDILSSTLVVTGTTANAVYVQSNGIRIASYVLPARPAEMWCMSESSFGQRHVLCVRCDDEKRSFFMLEYCSTLQNASMELLLSFNNVGHAYTGQFADIQAFDVISPQVFLLNDVPGISGTSTSRIKSKAIASKPTENGQLVKRSVLVTQKTPALDTKFSCHRLRLREDKQSKHGSSSRKRSRNGAKSGSKDAPGASKTETFRYIERTQKASSRDRRANHFDEDTEDEANTLAASQSQLAKLAESLSRRLTTGLQELERLQLIVGDKCLLARQLNQLIVRQWQKRHGIATHSTEGDNPFSESKGLIDMETIISAPLNAPRIVVKDVPGSPGGDLKLSLELFRVLQYVPSSSLVQAEVVLKNASDTTLNESFAVLTAPKGVPTQGWRCSSSVIPEYSGTARFALELQFAPSFSFLRERKPLDVTLWLHWGASRDHCMDLAWRPGESALAVASVKIYPDDLVEAVRESLPSGDVAYPEQNQLLFLSSGSSFESLFRQPSFEVSTSVGSVIRPTFALVHLNATSRELMLYELGRMVASLPRDVYAMQNPLQLTHFRALQRVLQSMRQETLAVLQRDSNESKQTRRAKGPNPASIHRSMQSHTDIQVTRLLQLLQKRANFHTMWFDALPTL
ncbi:hypothetical protein V7S43_012355 [Phytophthora oleae]|uniref:Uncharacterized protein n=1 Tax=Phytophthora oleae TaxID=2107226 RepID=A0ABD3FAH7_9STRA